jgi:hypothetical protein
MAIAFPSIDFSVGKPFAHRILAPWLVGLLFNDVELGFTVCNALFCIFFIVVLFFFLIQNKVSKRIAFLITTAFIFNRYFIPNFAFEPYRLADVLSNLLLLLSLIFLEKKKYAPVFILSILGVLTRESALLIIPVGMTYILMNHQKNKLPAFILLSTVLFIIFICIRIFIPVEGGISIFQALSENWTKLFSPEVIAKQLFLAFNPLFLIPLFNYREFIEFNKNNLHWLALFIFVLFSSLFGGDKERLMFSYAPIYYLFIGVLIQKLDERLRIKALDVTIILITCWISNLHHIWGIIKLPSREMSLIFALAGGLIVLMIYESLKTKRRVIN